MRRSSDGTTGDNIASGPGFTTGPPLKRQLSDIFDHGETDMEISIDSQVFHTNQLVLIEF